jgi:MFS transporter, DHA1 family, multidrug resistance protein
MPVIKTPASSFMSTWRNEAHHKSKEIDVREVPAQSANATLTRKDMTILVPVWVTVFAGMFWISSVRPFASDIASALGTSVSMVGQVATLTMLAMAIAGLFSGPVADHIGHRRSMVGGLILMAVAAGMLSASVHIAMLLTAGLVGGIGISMTYGVAMGVVATTFQGDQRRKALGMTQGFASTATIVCAPILTLIATLAVWRGSHLFMMLAIFAAAAIVYNTMPCDARKLREPVSPRVVLRAYAPLWQSRPTLRLFLASGTRGILSMGAAIYIGAFYVDRYGMSLSEVGIASAIEGLGLVAGSVAGGTLASRFRLRPLFAAAMCLIGAGWFAVYALQPPVLAAVATVVGITFLIGVTMTVLTSLIAEESPCGPATTMVLNISAIGFGAAIGAAYGGILIGAGGYAAFGIGTIPFAIVSSLLVWRPASAPFFARPRLTGQHGDQVG